MVSFETNPYPHNAIKTICREKKNRWVLWGSHQIQSVILVSFFSLCLKRENQKIIVVYANFTIVLFANSGNIVTFALKLYIMIENIEFEAKGHNQSEIRLQHSTGETTTLFFSSVFPMQAQEYYLKAINALVKQKPNLSSKDDLFSVFTGWFLRYSLEMPLGVGTSKNEERIRIGNRIKEIREEKKLEAKTLAMLTGIDAANLCRIEQGKQSAGIDVLSKIANAMGYKIDFVELKK